MDLRLYDLREDDFDGIIRLGNKVHGEDYVNHASLEKIHRQSCGRGLCCSKVMYDKPRGVGDLIGFRLTYAPGAWDIDEWCSPDEWGAPPEKVCYFKSNTLDSDYRRQGIGSVLLDVSIQTAQRLGAVAGAAHIWMQSPGASAYRYFTKNGGQLIWVWPARWNEENEKEGYSCSRCGTDCQCDAAEMILHFGELE